MKTRLIAIAVISLSAIGLNQAQAEQQDSTAPRSSLSWSAMTPSANRNNASLSDAIYAYTQAVRGQAMAPSNAGVLTPLTK